MAAEQAAAAKPDSLAKADALVADLKAREAAAANIEGKNAAPTGVPSNSSPRMTSPIRGETWWRQEMRARQEKLDEEVARMMAADFQMKNAMARGNYDREQAELTARRAAVASAREAVERLLEEAKLLNIPPEWLTSP